MEAPARCERARVNWRLMNQNATDVRWTGHWEKREEGRRAVCEIAFEPISAARTIQLHAGFADNHDEAAGQCALAGKKWLERNSKVKRFLWTGHWRRASDSAGTLCEFRYIDPDSPSGEVEVQAAAISGNEDAALQCDEARMSWQKRHPDVLSSRWTGEWSRAVDGRFVCVVDYMTADARPLRFSATRFSD